MNIFYAMIREFIQLILQHLVATAHWQRDYMKQSATLLLVQYEQTMTRLIQMLESNKKIDRHKQFKTYFMSNLVHQAYLFATDRQYLLLFEHIYYFNLVFGLKRHGVTNLITQHNL